MPQDAVHSMETGGSCHTTLSASPTTSGIIPSLFIRFLNTADTDKGTAVNHHRRSPGLSRGLLGGYLRQPSGLCPRDAFTYQSGGDLGCGLVDVYGGECLPTTLVAVTTSYFSSRNFRQSLVLTLL